MKYTDEPIKKAFYNGEHFLKVNCEDITHDVTHWMQLPQPPKEVDNGKID